MPRYDRRCTACSWIALDVCERADQIPPICPTCGATTERAWLSSATVIGDECDFVSHHGEKQPVHFRSKQEHKRWLKQHGYRINDAHVGEQGSDKNKHTSRLATMDPQTMKNAQELVARTAVAPAIGSEDDGPRGLTSDEGVLRYLTDRAKIERGEYL